MLYTYGYKYYTPICILMNEYIRIYVCIFSVCYMCMHTFKICAGIYQNVCMHTFSMLHIYAYIQNVCMHTFNMHIFDMILNVYIQHTYIHMYTQCIHTHMCTHTHVYTHTYDLNVNTHTCILIACIHYSVWQCVALCYSVSQCVAVCCSVLHCVAVCYNVLQSVYTYIYSHHTRIHISYSTECMHTHVYTHCMHTIYMMLNVCI